jgi:TolA-binding protein
MGALLVFASLGLRAQDAQPSTARPEATQPPVAQPVPDASSTETNGAPVAQPVGAANGAPAPNLVILNPAVVRFDSAMSAFKAGNYADAITAFSDFIRDFPNDRRREEALFRLAEAYRNLGRSDDALAAFTFEVKSYPDGPLRVNAELQRGALLFDAGKYADAIPALQLVADKGAGEVQDAAKYLLSRADLAAQKEADGRALLEGFVTAQPPGKYAGDSAQALAELDDTENHPADALPLWQEALSLTADPAMQATIAARGGWDALETKQLDAAEKLFQAARKADPSGEARKVANTGLLRLLFQEKRYGEWVATYGAEKDKLLDSARAEILYDLGHAQFTLKHWAESAEAFDQYLREFGTQPSAMTAAYERFLAGTQMDRTKTVGEAEAFLKAWPQSPDRARVRLIEAQELSAEKNFTQALPLWEELAKEKGDASWPHRDILLQLARSRDELHDWADAATAYQAYLDDVANHPGDNPHDDAKENLKVEARLAACLQNADQLAAATQAWQLVQSMAPAGSSEQQTALESLGLIYAKGGPPDEARMVAAFSELLQKYPQSPLRALAAFTVGDSFFRNHDYARAEPLLIEAREWDPKTWAQPATQRLALGAYGLKDINKGLTYMKLYNALESTEKAPALPAAFYYWLAEDARKKANWALAEALYYVVTRNPDPGNLLAGAWWQLGQVQSEQKEWPAAVASYENYRTLKPDAKDATVVLLALGRAQLGAQNLDAAKALGQQALLQEPEGPNSAASRMLLAETAFAAKSYPEAARMFATLALLFDDPKITPQAIARAADAFTAAGDTKSAQDWRAKLQAKYPQFVAAPYL